MMGKQTAPCRIFGKTVLSLVLALLVTGVAGAQNDAPATALSGMEGSASGPQVDTLSPAVTDAGAIDEAKVDQPLVTNMFFDTNLRQALADISAQTRVIIVPDESVRGFITCELQDVPLDQALNIVLSVGGFISRQMDGFILVGSPDPTSPHFYKMSETRSFRLDYLKAEDAVGMLNESMAKFVKPNKKNDTVCITAPRELLAYIEETLHALDKPQPQIVLEARVVELAKAHTERLGIDWSYEWMKPVEVDGLKSGSSSWDPMNGTLGLSYTTTSEYTRQLLMTLSLLVENEWATIVANPRITVQDGEQAQIKVTMEEYFIIVTEGAYYRSDLEKIESGITLDVLPRISSQGDILLQVSPEVSNVVGTGAQDLPVITRRTVSTTVRVKDGGTVIVAGLMSNLNRSGESKVPILGDIPLLGALFRSDAVVDHERQISVLITPRIVDMENRAIHQEVAPPRTAKPVGDEFRQQLLTSLQRYPEE